MSITTLISNNQVNNYNKNITIQDSNEIKGINYITLNIEQIKNKSIQNNLILNNNFNEYNKNISLNNSNEIQGINYITLNIEQIKNKQIQSNKIIENIYNDYNKNISLNNSNEIQGINYINLQLEQIKNKSIQNNLILNNNFNEYNKNITIQDSNEIQGINYITLNITSAPLFLFYNDETKTNQITNLTLNLKIDSPLLNIINDNNKVFDKTIYMTRNEIFDNLDYKQVQLIATNDMDYSNENISFIYGQNSYSDKHYLFNEKVITSWFNIKRNIILNTSNGQTIQTLTSGSQTTGLFTTNSSSQIKNLNGINSIIIEQDRPTNTEIKFYLSFDNQQSWVYYDTTNNNYNNSITDISNQDLISTGNTIQELEQYFSNYQNLNQNKTLDIQIGFISTDGNNSPSLQKITIKYDSDIDRINGGYQKQILQTLPTSNELIPITVYSHLDLSSINISDNLLGQDLHSYLQLEHLEINNEILQTTPLKILPITLSYYGYHINTNDYIETIDDNDNIEINYYTQTEIKYVNLIEKFIFQYTLDNDNITTTDIYIPYQNETIPLLIKLNLVNNN